MRKSTYLKGDVIVLDYCPFSNGTKLNDTGRYAVVVNDLITEFKDELTVIKIGGSIRLGATRILIEKNSEAYKMMRLNKKSVIYVDNIATIKAESIRYSRGKCPDYILKQIDNCLKIYFGI